MSPQSPLPSIEFHPVDGQRMDKRLCQPAPRSSAPLSQRLLRSRQGAFDDDRARCGLQILTGVGFRS